MHAAEIEQGFHDGCQSGILSARLLHVPTVVAVGKATNWGLYYDCMAPSHTLELNFGTAVWQQEAPLVSRHLLTFQETFFARSLTSNVFLGGILLCVCVIMLYTLLCTLIKTSFPIGYSTYVFALFPLPHSPPHLLVLLLRLSNTTIWCDQVLC